MGATNGGWEGEGSVQMGVTMCYGTAMSSVSLYCRN